jgi:hypothetical protein
MKPPPRPGEAGETAAAWVAAERSVATVERAGLPLLAADGDFRRVRVFVSAANWIRRSELPACYR